MTPLIGESWWRPGENVFITDVIGKATDYDVCFVNETGIHGRVPLAEFVTRYKRGFVVN